MPANIEEHAAVFRQNLHRFDRPLRWRRQIFMLIAGLLAANLVMLVLNIVFHGPAGYVAFYAPVAAIEFIAFVVSFVDLQRYRPRHRLAQKAFVQQEALKVLAALQNESPSE